jgi:murein DD-endopeptidase MepM/ murein hydrolase activator NlpD
MPQEGSRRRKKSHLYEIMIIPQGDGTRPVSFRASRTKLILFSALAFLVSVCITLAVLVFTPVAMYIPIPNPGLEERYGRQIGEMQQQLHALTQEFLVVKDYNQQMRKALGEGSTGDSSTVGKTPVTITADEPYEEQKGASVPVSSKEYDPPSIAERAGYDPTVVTTGNSRPSAFPLFSPMTEGFVTQEFEPARHHYGLDFAGKVGSPVYAASDGHVIFAGWTYDDGNMLIISHGGGYLTVYKHNQMLLTSAQAVVSRGEPVALLGTSGKTSLGPHLHFEVWKDGIPRDPNQFLLTPSKGGG